MRIVHLCLSNFYIDGYAYQENIIPRINHEDGHIVRIIASTETFSNNVDYGYVKSGEYLTEYGVPIKRIDYCRIINSFVTHKFRKYKELSDELEKFRPDVIMVHGLSFYSIKDVVKYKKKNKDVKVYADTHSAFYNSGTNWISLHVLHRLFYRKLIKRSIPHIDKVFYIGEAEKDFAIKNYRISESKMEFLPLGGFVFSDEKYNSIREEIRNHLGVSETTRVYMHAGKLDRMKKTEDLIAAFSSINDPNSRLIIIGSIPEDREAVLLPLIKADERINYLGWVCGDDLQKYLCACDLYCQPYDTSSIFQNAICCRCAVMTFPHDYYTKAYDFGNIVWEKGVNDMMKAFEDIMYGRLDLVSLKEKSKEFAEKYLDYRKIASRLYR